MDAKSSAGPQNKASLSVRFNNWRRMRPFGAGLCMIISGLVMLTPAYLTIDVQGILISISTLSGVSTLLIGLLLIAAGVLTWTGGSSRILTGTTALVLSIVALPTSNFGGFVLGTVLGLIGGALALSWYPDYEMETGDEGDQKDVETPSRPKGKQFLVSTILAVGGVLMGMLAPAPHASAAPGFAPLPIPGIANFNHLPTLPEIQLPPGNSITDSPLPSGVSNSLVDEADGISLREAPTPQPGELGLSDTLEMITADSVRLIGNVHFSLVDLTMPAGDSVQAIRLDANRVELNNLGLSIPGGGVQLATGPGSASILDGNFHIIVRKMTVSPEVAGLKGPSISLDYQSLQDKDVRSVMSEALGLPDWATSQLVLHDVILETYVVRSDALELPSTTQISNS
ncbi:DUF6114 domain-containing protein [Corynebacterium sp. HMSC072D01]|uniref:DUF6114 domain-containing protein n=1 Tax=Corynebacterium sp. HMSC072D01 TaxID=1739403 RepID=UPI0021109C92|nr:DUF6114 domain-containing protein [Corynebacterium sp. HMSC072D01]